MSEGGGFYNSLGSKLGSSASKYGKKVAQSEAGKSAGRAAIKGASDAAAEDLSNRYFGEETGSHTPTQLVKKGPVDKGVHSPASQRKLSPQPMRVSGKTDSDEEYEIMIEESRKRERMGHQKASKFSRFKPVVNLQGGGKSTQTKTPKPTIGRGTRRRDYKYALAGQPDWDTLPQAISLYSYRAEMQCDLEFRKGQVIQIITRTHSQNDWWEGQLDGKVGIFPANYVRVL